MLRLTLNGLTCLQEHDRVWLRKVDTESPGDTRTCGGPDDIYDLWVDSVAPEAVAEPSAPVGQGASAAATVHARSTIGTLALLLTALAYTAA